MKKKTQNKLMFKKMELVELTTKNLLAIRGGVEGTGVDLPSFTFTQNGNGGLVSNSK